MNQRNVIIVTDGDELARHAVEIGAKNIGGRCISVSAGNPTTLSGSEIAEQVMKAAYDPVVVMFDDNGNFNRGSGEKAISSLSTFPQIKILGAVAVASGANPDHGVKVTFSIDKHGNKIYSGVDKNGNAIQDDKVFGDTIQVLEELNLPVVVGLGDPGKMDELDSPQKGSPITTQALKSILENPCEH